MAAATPSVWVTVGAFTSASTGVSIGPGPVQLILMFLAPASCRRVRSHTRRTHNTLIIHTDKDTPQIRIHDGITVFVFRIHDLFASTEHACEVCRA